MGRLDSLISRLRAAGVTEYVGPLDPDAPEHTPPVTLRLGPPPTEKREAARDTSSNREQPQDVGFGITVKKPGAFT